eukprot:evm.model.scf_2020EXC.1 EVM.evm.TU.scf_2020EXC.1   scf_2020EXC:3857-5416(+)
MDATPPTGWTDVRRRAERVEGTYGAAMVKSARLVNRRWSQWANGAAEFLSPSGAGGSTVEKLDAIVRRFPRLSRLDLRRCGDTGDCALRPLPRVPRLASLDLANCSRVTDAGFLSLTRLVGLKHLDVSGCSGVSSEGLMCLTGISNLTSLDLSRLGVVDKLLGGLAALGSLADLELRNCHQITDAGLELMEGMERLTHLNISECSAITDDGMRSVGKLSTLRSLSLSRLAITDEGMEHICGLKLQSLDLSYCDLISDKGLRRMECISRLTHLDVSRCLGICAEGRHSFMVSLAAIASLNLSRRLLTDDAMDHLGRMDGLRILCLADCQLIADIGFEPLQSLTRLTDLDVSGCANIANGHIRSLGKISKLSALNLSRLCIEDGCLGHLLELSDLSVLCLRDCPLITDGAIAHLKAMSRIEKLDVGLRPSHSGTEHSPELGAMTCDDVSKRGGSTSGEARGLGSHTETTRFEEGGPDALEGPQCYDVPVAGKFRHAMRCIRTQLESCMWSLPASHGVDDVR